MSITLYITPEVKIPGVELNQDRCALAENLQSLTEIAQKLRVKPLENFQSYTDDDLPEPMGLDTPPEYFESAAALETVDALIAHLSQARPPDMESTVKDLQNCRTALAALKSANIRFRFHLGD